MSELSVEIDRTALCIHTLARADGSIRDHLVSIGMPVPPLLPGMATVMARRAFTFDDMVLQQRYTPKGALRAVVDAHVAGGMLTAQDGVYEPTELARDAARLVVDRQGELITEAWRGASAALVADIVDAVPTGIHAAFDQQVGVLPEGATEEHRLLRLLTALRYLKSDVHAAALARHGISAADAPDIDRRWRDGESIPARDAVEVDTDRDLVELLGGRETELLTLLRSLPGVDPR